MNLLSMAGIGLRAQHYQAVLDKLPNIGWVEVHCENYFGKGGNPFYYLDRVSQHYPVSLHGVGLSLGSVDNLDLLHLAKLKRLVEHYNPVFVSEHLSWSSISGHHLNDLLPLPYTEETLKTIVFHINQVQDYLNRPILIENISSYLEFSYSTIPEYEFINEIAYQTGCGILLDINNLFVNSINHGWDTQQYLENISCKSIKEIHLAGFMENHFAGGSLLIDTHSTPVAAPVWVLYARAIEHFGPIPTLIEWDKEIPELPVLLAEANKAQQILEQTRAISA